MKNNSQNIRFSFLGGASDIGAFCIFVEIDSANFIIDGGIKLEGSNPLPDLSMLNDKQVDAILLTHAHIDHSGALPILSESFPSVPIYATPPTIDIVKILLYDSLKIMNSEREGELPLYGAKQVQNLLTRLVPCNFNYPISIKDVVINFLPASHILGASMIHLSSSSGNILITGDYSITSQLTVPALSLPTLPVDIIVTESTYGARLHENRVIAEKRLISKIKEVIDNDGTVLIPCFAVGRAQEVLLILIKAFRNGELTDVPVFVDGMVRTVCDIYKNYETYTTRWLAREIRKNPHPFYQRNIRPVEPGEDKNKIASTHPSIIIASSGMLNGGASVIYAKLIARNENNAILITGYQDEESPGYALLSLSEKPTNRFLNIDGNNIQFNCKVEKYGLSAHADRLQIINFVESLKPQKIILVHGDEEAKSRLAEGLSDYDVVKGYNGLILECSVKKVRKKKSVKISPISLDKTDLEYLRGLLGPPTNKPISAREIAKTIFGKRITAKIVNLLAEKLEMFGLVRRDDKNRTMLWILPPSENRILQSEAEEEKLKKENPKGRLLEICARLRIEPPLIETKVEGYYYLAKMSLNFFGEKLISQTYRASSAKIAEHKAAQEIIKLIEEKQLKEADTIKVKEEEVDILKNSNPKGKLLEWCMTNKINPPIFEKRITSNGYNVKAIIKINESNSIESKWHCHSVLKIAEHSSCREILALCNKMDEPTIDKIKASGDSNIIADPRSILNHLKQINKIVDFDLSQIIQEGPPHLPIFKIIGSAVLKDGKRIKTNQIQAHTKKEAQRLAAEELLKLIGN